MSTAIHVGSPIPEISPESFNDLFRSEWLTFYFHNFKNSSLNEVIDSPTFSCFGCQWKLQLCKIQNGHNGYVKMDLTLLPQLSSANPKIKGKFRYSRVNLRKGEPEMLEISQNYKPFSVGHDDSPASFRCRLDCFVAEGKYLCNGTLPLKLEMYVHSDSQITSGSDNQIRQVMLNILSDENTADMISRLT